jgi:hypothetical protein
MKPCHRICLSLVLSILMGCVTNSPRNHRNTSPSRHPEFTPENLIDLRPGMTEKEIEAIFGSPDRTSVITLGKKTPYPWPSLIYYYDMRKDRIGRYKYNVYTNTFYFVTDVQPPLLRFWELELIYPEGK